LGEQAKTLLDAIMATGASFGDALAQMLPAVSRDSLVAMIRELVRPADTLGFFPNRPTMSLLHEVATVDQGLAQTVYANLDGLRTTGAWGPLELKGDLWLPQWVLHLPMGLRVGGNLVDPGSLWDGVLPADAEVEGDVRTPKLWNGLKADAWRARYPQGFGRDEGVDGRPDGGGAG
jgi:hypothetical protein